MAASKLQFCLIILGTIIPRCCCGEICLPKRHAALFVFGASMFDVGNNNYFQTFIQANRRPYGQTFFNCPTGRFSNGRVIPDFIAGYAKLPLTLPYLYPGYQRYIDGVNFASAGAGALLETHKGMVIDLKSQLVGFKNVSKLLRPQLGKSKTKELLSKAVYLLNIGANDYSARLTENSSVLLSYSEEKFVDVVIGNQTSVIKEIYKMGGRKFGLLGVGPLGCQPSMKALVKGSAGSRMERAQILAKQHNAQLAEALQKLERNLEGFKYSFTNFNDLVLEVMNHPFKYGFKEGRVACCGSGPYRGHFNCGGRPGTEEYELCENPNDYVFFDSVHPTDKAAQLYAQEMWSGNGNFTRPYNLSTLFKL